MEDFVEIYETHESNIHLILSNTRIFFSEIFLKKAKKHLIMKPRTYFHILSLKQINEHLIEKIFPNLLPREESSFATNKAFDYLRYYPDNKKYELLRKSYESKYNNNFFFEMKNVTEDLLKLLPTKERIKRARMMFAKEKYERKGVFLYETNWICYYPVNTAIPHLKEQINITRNERTRYDLIEKMMKVCMNNKDDDALSDTLMYFLNRHKNERYSVFDMLFRFLNVHYSPHNFNEKQLSLVVEII